jgi:cytochrome c biogenesis protein
MSVSTHGWRLKTPSHALRSAVELLSSMRFSISLLTVICIASVIGTVLKQGEPQANYINQFGPFWAEVFSAFKLPSVYSAWWFLLILAFLVLSTTLCIVRNTPKIIADLKVFKEGMREQSLQAFGHRAEAGLPEVAEAAAQRIGNTLAASGWKVKLQTRLQNDGVTPRGYMLAAKAGSANKLGYIAAHSAIVLVCVGGLLDGDLFIRLQQWFGGKSIYGGGGMIADIAPEHRLGPGNLAFRGNMLVAEGASSSTAILNQTGGVLIQDLPFSIALKKFVVEHYSTGMPKLFASDIVITDKDTGEKIPARVEVNHPASYRGIEIYQSSFDDGGSNVKLRAIPLTAGAKPFDVEGVIGGQTLLSKASASGPEQLTLEYSALRVINVENFSAQGDGSGTDVRKVDLRASLDKSLGAANKVKVNKELRNVGPSITYKLRDAAGQATEFHNYMLPVVLESDDKGEGLPLYLLGMRSKPEEPFSYLRVPADEQGSIDGFARLRVALADPALRQQAVERYIAVAVPQDKPQLAEQLRVSATRALGLFAGAEKVDGKPVQGLQAVSDFIEANVPQAERERAGEVLVRVLNGSIFELLQLSRTQAGLPALQPDAKTQAFMAQAVVSLSDAFFYPAPMAFALTDFTQVQASVFQLARAPGKWVVYTGCLFLIIGVFAMLYVRERRLWVWLTPSSGAAALAQMALSTNRKTMDGDQEFELLKAKLLGLQTSSPPLGRSL